MSAGGPQFQFRGHNRHRNRRVLICGISTYKRLRLVFFWWHTLNTRYHVHHMWRCMSFVRGYTYMCTCTVCTPAYTRTRYLHQLEKIKKNLWHVWCTRAPGYICTIDLSSVFCCPLSLLFNTSSNVNRTQFLLCNCQCIHVRPCVHVPDTGINLHKQKDTFLSNGWFGTVDAF